MTFYDLISRADTVADAGAVEATEADVVVMAAVVVAMEAAVADMEVVAAATNRGATAVKGKCI